MRSSADVAAGPVVEKFSAGGGQWPGFVAAAMGVALVGGATIEGIVDNWRLAAFGLALMLLGWSVMIRPSVSAHEHGLLLRNIGRDVLVPWGSVERCKALQTLQVATPQGTVHGLALSRSARSMLRQQVGGRTVMGRAYGTRRPAVPNPTGEANQEVLSSATYSDFVESRILSIAQTRRAEPAPLMVAIAPLPIIALVTAAALTVVGIFA